MLNSRTEPAGAPLIEWYRLSTFKGIAVSRNVAGANLGLPVATKVARDLQAILLGGFGLAEVASGKSKHLMSFLLFLK
jgi:hypothetical protein